MRENLKKRKLEEERDTAERLKELRKLKEEPETQREALESEADTEAISTSINVRMVKLYSEAFQNIVAKPEPH